MLAAMFNAILSVSAYVYFFWSLPLAATAFMINFDIGSLAPGLSPYFPFYSIDANPPIAGWEDQQSRLLVNVALLGLFAIPHSIFARSAVKDTFAVLGSMYRPFYTFKSAACLHLLIKFWQPVDDTVLWDFSAGPCHDALLAGYVLGWVWLVTTTFSLDHFELFGLKDGLGIDFMGKLGYGNADGKLVERAHYTLCRHPIMLGFFIMFFVVPTMTVTHMFFSVACTAYIHLAVTFLEEPDLEKALGGQYRDYQQRVPMYCPFFSKSGSGAAAKSE